MSHTTLVSAMPQAPIEHSFKSMRVRIVLTIIVSMFALIACKDAWLDIIRIVQKDEEASHILLVPLVFARLVWVRRSSMMGWSASASWWGPLISLLGVALWLIGNIKAMQIVWHFGAIVTLIGAFVCINGWDILRRLWPAFLVLIFLMPLPGTIRHPLALFMQNASAQATEIVIVAMGFDLVRHGNLLLINDYPVGIAEACNGMRMVSMLILVVFAFVFSEKIRLWVRILLIIIAAPMAILCNIIRLVPTVLAYGYLSPDFADQLHDWLGWVMVVASYFMLMCVLALMRWLLLPVDPGPEFSRSKSLRSRWISLGRQIKDDEYPATRLSRTIAPTLVVIMVLCSAYVMGSSLPDGSETKTYHARVKAVADDLPRQVGAWSSIDTEVPEAAVALLRPNVLISRRYENDETGRSFALLLVQCADARDMEGHYPPNCYPTSGWTSLGHRSVQSKVADFDAVLMDYLFERQLQDGMESIAVVNMIAVPGDGFVTTMSSIRRLGGTVQDRYYGAAQVQFVFDSRWDKNERLAVVEEFGLALEPLLRVILDKAGK